MKVKALWLAIAAALCGCTPPPKPAAVVSFCEAAAPIMWDNAQQLEATPVPLVRRVLVHNRTGEKLCDW